jgi:hypothetical protein
LEEDDKWKIILERIATEEIPDEALKASGFWSKILVEDDKWDIMLTRIRDNAILEKALNVDSFWSKILVEDDQWKLILEHLKNVRLKTLFSGSVFWTHCTEDWTKFFEHARNRKQKRITQNFLKNYCKEHPRF